MMKMWDIAKSNQGMTLREFRRNYELGVTTFVVTVHAFHYVYYVFGDTIISHDFPVVLGIRCQMLSISLPFK